MRWFTFFDRLLRVLFVFYCIEVGLFLVIAPWRQVWPQLLVHVPSGTARVWLLLPFGRGAVTGFGLVHLLWGVHDIRELLFPRRRHHEGRPAPLVGDHRRHSES
jgi:hypothetical protein